MFILLSVSVCAVTVDQGTLVNPSLSNATYSFNRDVEVTQLVVGPYCMNITGSIYNGEYCDTYTSPVTISFPVGQMSGAATSVSKDAMTAYIVVLSLLGAIFVIALLSFVIGALLYVLGHGEGMDLLGILKIMAIIMLSTLIAGACTVMFAYLGSA